jgi:hypothetical protein
VVPVDVPRSWRAQPCLKPVALKEFILVNREALLAEVSLT